MLEVRRLTKRFGALTAVRDVSFVVRPGEVLGYLGPNGSGKTTTVRMLAGLFPPTMGGIFFDGADIQHDLTRYKALVGYVPEEAHVYTYLTAPEYLRLCGRLRRLPASTLERKIERFLEILGLGIAKHASLGSFSKGMRQKVLLAAALIHNPRVVIFDEATSGLDVPTARVLRAIVKALAADGRIVFYSSHELDTVERISSRVMILRSGAVVADDSPSNLRELMHLPSLEDVFSALAVSIDVDSIAGELLEAVRL